MNETSLNFSNPSDVTKAMVVTSSGPQTTQKAQGETVNLGCTYTPSPEDTGELDIEWSNVSPDMTQKDKLVGLRTDLINMLERGISFPSGLCWLKNLLWRSDITHRHLGMSDLIVHWRSDAPIRRSQRLQPAEVHRGPQAGRCLHLYLWCEGLRHSNIPV